MRGSKNLKSTMHPVLGFAYRFLHIGSSLRYWLSRRLTPAGWLALTGLIMSGFVGADPDQSIAYHVCRVVLSVRRGHTVVSAVPRTICCRAAFAALRQRAATVREPDYRAEPGSKELGGAGVFRRDCRPSPHTGTVYRVSPCWRWQPLFSADPGCGQAI